MTHRYIKIGATSLVLVLAFAGMLWSTLREGTEYYKNIDEVMVNQQAWHGSGPLSHHPMKNGAGHLRGSSAGLGGLPGRPVFC